MTRSELLLAIDKCNRAMLARGARGRDDWPKREEFWEIHDEKCRLFAELYKRDQALTARFEQGLPAERGAKPALELVRRKTDNGSLF